MGSLFFALRCAPRAERRSRNGPSSPRASPIFCVSLDKRSRPSTTTHCDSLNPSSKSACPSPSPSQKARVGGLGSLKKILIRWRASSSVGSSVEGEHDDGATSSRILSSVLSRSADSSAGRR
eukprot:scaffold3955_cov26-Tisochrysis_lutea.AAC.2